LLSDELDLQLKINRLELEHHDGVESRNAILFAEWTIPLAIFTTALTKGYITDFWSFIGVVIGTYLPYRLIKSERVIRDNLLEGIRNQIDDLMEKARKAEASNKNRKIPKRRQRTRTS
jgi:hypothetical protein